jgi:hypothetical protein
VDVIRLDAGLDCIPGWEALTVRVEDSVRVRPFFERMEFHSFVRDADQPALL